MRGYSLKHIGLNERDNSERCAAILQAFWRLQMLLTLIFYAVMCCHPSSLELSPELLQSNYLHPVSTSICRMNDEAIQWSLLNCALWFDTLPRSCSQHWLQQHVMQQSGCWWWWHRGAIRCVLLDIHLLPFWSPASPSCAMDNREQDCLSPSARRLMSAWL